MTILPSPSRETRTGRGGSWNAIPTLGYPTQRAAVIALYEQRVEPKAIAERTGATINSVHRAIHDYRVSSGRYIAPIRESPKADRIPAMGNIWELDDYQRGLAFARRAAAGARAARLAQA